MKRREARQSRALDDQSIEASKERCKTLAGFIREAWHVVEPNAELEWNWHIDAICAHLEAVTYGSITRLLINVPPGTLKSLLVSVFWPAFEWGPAGLPGMRYFTTSYIIELAARDSRKMRDLVQSEWFQARWGNRCELVRTGETDFSNVSLGWRQAMAFLSLTGGRGDRVIIDDPHSVNTAESETDREKVIRTLRESVPSRVMDPKTSAIVIVMQRLHVNDATGVTLSLGLGYVHLCLPMEFEPDRRCETVIGFKDPRTYEGELLFGERWTRQVVDDLKRTLGGYAWVGQYQQRPTMREGGLFKRAWFNKVKHAERGTRWVRYWDLAATAEQVGTKPAYTAGVLLGRQPSGRWVIGHVIRERAEGTGVRKLIRDTAASDGQSVEIGFPQDPGQAGKTQAQSLVAMLPLNVVKALRESGDKITRAEPIASQAEAGLLDMVEGPWNETFIEEATNFPGSDFKDQVDALSGAYALLIGASMFTTPENDIAIEATRIPETWPRCCALIVTRTAVSTVWMAHQPSTDTAYVYDAITKPLTNFAVHASAIKDRGNWIPVVFNMFGEDRSEAEAHAIVGALQKQGLPVFNVDLDMESACIAMQDRFDASRLRVFENLRDWFGQYRTLARGENGEIEDAKHGILRATGLALSGLPVAITQARAASDASGGDQDDQRTPNNVTGY